jgi:hypothetical protein
VLEPFLDLKHTTTLFAMLNTLDGSVISMCQQRHQHEE